MARSQLFAFLRRALASARPAGDAGGLSRRDLMTRTLGGVAIAGLAVGCSDDDERGGDAEVGDGSDADGTGDGTAGDSAADGTPDGSGDGAKVVVVGLWMV